MYADDLALISSSEADLHHMLSMVSDYALMWRYHFNAAKSAVLVFGESPVSRKKNRPLRKWLVSGSPIPECDSQHHLGILRTVSPSSVLRTIERCSSGRSAFFALNAVGSRFGCLHPSTSFRLYSSFCLPILLYGCELWSLTGSEIIMLERVHRKILRTIQGLPLRSWNNFRIRLLVGCHGLEEDTSRFAQRRPPITTPYAPTCKLCGLEPEDPAHFIVRCPALARTRNSMLQSSSYLTTLFFSDPDKFLGVVLGTEWIDDKPLQLFIIEFLNRLRLVHNTLLLSAH